MTGRIHSMGHCHHGRCRLVPDDGQGIGGLPNVRIFGALLRSQHALMLLAAMVLAGPKGLILVAILW